MQVPAELRYTEDHEWVQELGDSVVRIGITDYAQDQLGDVVYVELPAVGDAVEREDLVAELESTKSVGEVYAPVAGEIVAVNQTLADSPDLINTSPYQDGWLVELQFADGVPLDGLLDAASYRDLTE